MKALGFSPQEVSGMRRGWGPSQKQRVENARGESESGPGRVREKSPPSQKT